MNSRNFSILYSIVTKVVKNYKNSRLFLNLKKNIDSQGLKNFTVSIFQCIVNKINSMEQPTKYHEFVLNANKKNIIQKEGIENKSDNQTTVPEKDNLNFIHIDILLGSMIIICCSIVLFKIYWLKWLGDEGVFQ